MAKLSAHGIELLRISKEQNEGPESSCSWSRTTLAYMSDGVVMQKYDVRFKPTASWDPPEGRRHSYGWTLKKRTGEKGEKWFAFLRKVHTFMVEKGWTVEVNGIPVERVQS